MRGTTSEINTAIIKVLTSKFKKDAPEAFKLVESIPGYVVYKSQGRFVIKNTLTHQYAYGQYTRWNDSIIGIHFGIRDINLEKAKKVDWYGYFNTNSTERRNNRWIDPKSRSSYQFEQLNLKKWNVHYHSQEVRKIQAKIDQLQKDLEWQLTQKIKSEIELKSFRQELGLKEVR